MGFRKLQHDIVPGEMLVSFVLWLQNVDVVAINIKSVNIGTLFYRPV